ncbi:heme exporter protein CcmD [Gymnodinialimonas hymeniacidonis]|uniref:heme exporter protein CcmD n=1 Tax=Gymnodinialimonas hymeniacidonis TaxID=3126508 RepID=UPI0034C61995
MNVDLGQYAVEVLSAYAGAIVCLVAVIAASIIRARSVARRLAEMERQREARVR